MTLNELFAAAKAAVSAGDLEKAATLTEQAKALKAIHSVISLLDILDNSSARVIPK